MSLPVSILDLATVGSATTASQALDDSVELARRADELGYHRHWFAEHHSTPNITTACPEVLIAKTAEVTERIRIGSGGVMLPNHAPVQVAERFHTLEALYPERIDLGIGRAPGTNEATVRAMDSADRSEFPDQIREMITLSRGDFAEDHPYADVRVMPDDVELPPVWMLGSSGGSAELAGQLGVGYGYASHFSPAPAEPAIEAYRQQFEPSERFPEPHVILAASVVCADTDEKAEHLAQSLELSALRRERDDYSPVPSPEEASAYDYSPAEREFIQKLRHLHFVGSPETVHEELSAFVERTGADELMVTSIIHGAENRFRSFELIAEAFDL